MKRLNLLLMFVCLAVLMQAQSVVPQPNVYEKGEGQVVLNGNITIGYTDKGLKDAADYLATIVGGRSKATAKANVVLKLDASMQPSEYKLDVKAGAQEGVIIVGGDYRGVVCGIQTLRQISGSSGVSGSSASLGSSGVSLPVCTIKDKPRFGWRGLSLDVSRHFFNVQEVERLLDLMALYKLNKLHWHLTDDQGWRIEIKKYPKLTANGGWRKYNNQDTICMKRAVAEHNPDMQLQEDKKRVVNGDTLYGGYYTQKQIKEVVEYARVRGIDIIPEIDMPGHIICAEQNYEGISCFPETSWGRFFSSPLCPGKETAMQFCKNVYEEVVALFPYEYVHIGGDEVDKANWKKCPDCQKRMQDNNLKTEEELQSWFIHEMERFLNSKGKKMIGWNEIIEGGLSDTSTIMWWTSWVKDAGKITTAHGNDLIVTTNTDFYLDYEEGKDALKNIYNYDLLEGITAEQQKHVLGLQGNTWCEQIPSVARLDYMITTRMLAVAELGWAAAEPRNYYDFENRLIEQLPRLQKMGVNYRLRDLEGFSKVNAFVGEGLYHITCADPTITIRYTTDGSIPTQKSAVVPAEGLKVVETQTITFRGFRTDGKAGDYVVADFIKDNYSPATDITPSRNGLQNNWHEFPGIDCNKIKDAPLNGSWVTPDVCIPEQANGNIGLIITGYFYAPKDDVYTFTLLSDDGSDLAIDGKILIDMNREQSPVTTVAQKALQKGYHPICVRYFDHNGGCLNLKVSDSKGLVLPASETMFN